MVWLPPHLLCRLHALCSPFYASELPVARSSAHHALIFPFYCFSSTLIGSNDRNHLFYDGHSPNCVCTADSSELTVGVLKLFKYLKRATSVCQFELVSWAAC